MQVERLIRIGGRYLQIYSILASGLVLLCTGIGVAQMASGQARIRLPEPVDTICVAAVFGTAAVLTIANGTFLLVFCRTIAGCRGRVRWIDQLAVLAALIPWAGLYVYPHLQRLLECSASVDETAASE